MIPFQRLEGGASRLMLKVGAIVKASVVVTPTDNSVVMMIVERSRRRRVVLEKSFIIFIEIQVFWIVRRKI